MAGKSIQKQWTPLLIRRLRGKRTQEEFAQVIGAPKNTVWRWEAGTLTVGTTAAILIRLLAQQAAPKRRRRE